MERVQEGARQWLLSDSDWSDVVTATEALDTFGLLCEFAHREWSSRLKPELAQAGVAAVLTAFDETVSSFHPA